jgi:sec-independent protein translocase protein TatA
MMNQVHQAQFLSTGHIILILAAILLLFGGKKIPELMKGLGQGMKEFKDASKGKDSAKVEDSTNKGASSEEK